jgi:NDP-sugar pyrophosphorylase family protein
LGAHSDDVNGGRHAIVLAGGRGLRLWPRTRDLPKALVRVGDHTILEIILQQLVAARFARVTLCVAHLGSMIRDRLGDGRQLGLCIDYATDPRPLGTAGPLRLVTEWNEPALVVNCDILTTMDFAHVHRCHVASRCALTVVAKERELSIDSGVLDIAGGRVRRIWEKPQVAVSIAAGVYVADPSLREHLPEDVATDMPDLVSSLIAHGVPVNCYRWRGEWLDIGTSASLDEATLAVTRRPLAYLPDGAANALPDEGRRLAPPDPPADEGGRDGREEPGADGRVRLMLAELRG